MLRQSFIRAQRLSSLATSTSKRCRLEPQNFWCTDGGHPNSTSSASTQSHDANAGLSPATKHEPRPTVRPLASSLPRHSSPDDIVTLIDPISKRRKRGRPRRCTVATLDPARLDSSCFLDVSGISRIHIYDRLAPDSPSFLNIMYTRTEPNFDPFPPDTRGFLYFCLDVHNPLLSQIRFRVAQDYHDPARSFSSGHDLTYGSGFTWHITLMNAAKNRILREMLVRDGLIDGALLAQLQARPLSRGSYRLKRAISVLNQPFILDFRNLYLSFVVRVAGEARLYETKGPLIHYEEKSNYRAHDAGAALCRWERSTLPQHAGRRILVMRLLKILQPPKLRPDLLPTCNVRVPAEGELFTSAKGAWYRDVDKGGKSAEILRLLYDAPDDGGPASGQS